MSYPASLTPFLRRLQAHTTNTFKIEPSGARSSVGAGQVISFSLPSNTLLDLRSVKWLFNAKASGTCARLPNDISSLIERYTIEAGGVTIYQGHLGYNVVKHAKDALMASGDFEDSYAAAFSHENIPRAKDASGTAITGTNPEAPDDSGDATQFCVSKWLGFMEAQPYILDTSLCAELVLKIFLAPNSVIPTATGIDTFANFTTPSGTGSYTINNQRLLVTCYGIQDGTFDMMMEQRIKEQGFIEIPFKQYFTFFDNQHNGSTRFSLGTQSLDAVYGVWRKPDYQTSANVVAVSGFKAAFGDTSSNVLVGGHLGNSVHNGEKYQANYFAMPKPTGITSAQFSINGSLYPQFPATPDEWYSLSMDAVHDQYDLKAGSKVKSRAAWNDNYHVYAVRLNQPDADGLRLVSGLDSRSLNMAGYLNTAGVTNSPPCVVIAECTSTWRIGASMSSAVVV